MIDGEGDDVGGVDGEPKIVEVCRPRRHYINKIYCPVEKTVKVFNRIRTKVGERCHEYRCNQRKAKCLSRVVVAGIDSDPDAWVIISTSGHHTCTDIRGTVHPPLTF